MGMYMILFIGIYTYHIYASLKKSPTSQPVEVLKNLPLFKGQLGVPLTVYPWYL